MTRCSAAVPKREPAREVWFLSSLLCLLVSLPSGEMPEQGEGPGHRSQRLALTPAQEFDLGRRAYQEILNQYSGRIVPTGRPEDRKVRQIAARIVRAAGIRPLQREISLHLEGYRFEWEIHVIQSDQVNAFALPGGKVAVFSGLLPVARDDDQLATVLAHEIAHVLAHHASERLAREQSGAGFLRRRAYDRNQESEADKIGVFLMTFAGYDPHEAVAFWQRMQRVTDNRGRLPEIVSDHPSDARRIHDLERWVPNAVAAKKAYEAGRVVPEPSR